MKSSRYENGGLLFVSLPSHMTKAAGQKDKPKPITLKEKERKESEKKRKKRERKPFNSF